MTIDHKITAGMSKIVRWSGSGKNRDIDEICKNSRYLVIQRPGPVIDPVYYIETVFVDCIGGPGAIIPDPD